MKREALLLFLIITLNFPAIAQQNLQKIEGDGIITSDEVYVNEDGDKYASTFYVAFHEHILSNTDRVRGIGSSNISIEFPTLSEAINRLENDRDLREIKRLYPDFVTDNILHKSRTGESVTLTDRSKIFEFEFDKIQPLTEIRRILQSDLIRYIEAPEIVYLTSNTPNDPYYDKQWTLKLLESENVFHITDGSENIVLGISDAWTSNDTHGVHEELEGKIPAYQSGKWVPGGSSTFSHGTRIATIAAAKTDNNKGIASLGGKFQIVPANSGSFGLSYLLDICGNPPPIPGDPTSCDEFPDVINMSWTSTDYGPTKDAVEDLLDLGVVMVGTSVNDVWWDNCSSGPPCWPGQSTLGQPFIAYPASSNFSNGNQVISVAATQLTDNVNSIDVDQPFDPFQYQERFTFQNLGEPDEYIFNYGLSSDPVSNPDSAFTDVAAPSMKIFTAKGETATNDYGSHWGATSEAAPLVTSAIGMMLSVNPDLKGDPQEVYDILTSTTDYDTIEIPPGAVTNTLPDGRKYNKYTGFGRINAYKAVLASIPKENGFITSNRTWSGYKHIQSNVKVDNGATLSIDPGTTIVVDEDVNISIDSGAKLISEGTEEDPIRFIRSDPHEAWGTIYLNSSEENSIKWALFDGGSTNLTIASQNNTIENSTFRNATFRNIDSWHNQDGSGNSSATLSHVLIEDGATVGLVAQYIDLDISNTTIQDNAQAGMYITSASVYPFHHNEIINNGGSTRDGVEVMSSGTFYMQDDNLEDGFNEISDNGIDQVSGSGDIGVGFFYPESNGGYNSVHGDFSGSSYLVNNQSSTTVMAERVWWGESSLNQAMFNGPVQFDIWYLNTDPTAGENPGSGGQTPAKALPGKESEVLPLVEVYDQLENELAEAETSQQVRDGLHRLYQVAWLANKETPELAGRFRQLARQSAAGNHPLFESAHHNNTLQHTATLLYAKSYLREGEYENAAGWMRETDGAILEETDRRDWLHLEMDLLRHSGEYEQALGKLEELYAYEQSRGVDVETLKGNYAPIEQDLALRLGRDANVRDRLKQPTVSTSDQELVLENYPNPFNPTTQIRFTLPEQSQVSLVVYDMLGRQVARLVDEVLPAGEQSVRFDASNLANGVYIYRLNANQQERVRMMTLIK